MSTPAQIAYTPEQAAAATGYSRSQIDKALRAGDLVMRYPKVNGRNLKKGVIEHAELEAWVQSGATERAS
jgi:predicted DNA-binding transcriptional regulator AlpA